ncbi:MAG: DUF3786 domain-containing protein [Eubacteriales bacterium]|nr:DUF3786 domain-containing protein [Eubacteriales bacterium]
MSVNYHAYQCRKYYLHDYPKIAEQWTDMYAGYNPARIAGILHLTYTDTYLYIRYFQTWFRLCLESGRLEKADTDPVFSSGAADADPQRSAEAPDTNLNHYTGAPDTNPGLPAETAGTSVSNPDRIPEEDWTDEVRFNEAMVIYHILTYTIDSPAVSGEMVSNTSLDPTLSGANSPREKILYDSFSADFASEIDVLQARCERLGGTRIPGNGDLSYAFHPFPFVELHLRFWEKDEEFPAQTIVLVDKKITDYMHPETTGCIIADLFRLLSE